MATWAFDQRLPSAALEPLISGLPIFFHATYCNEPHHTADFEETPCRHHSLNRTLDRINGDNQRLQQLDFYADATACPSYLDLQSVK